jgi:hypothetical protein
VPPEFYESGLNDLEPSIQMGPVLGVPAKKGLQAFLPTPVLDQWDCEWINRSTSGPMTPEKLPPQPPYNVIPEQRAQVTEGWLNLVKRKAEGA